MIAKARYPIEKLINISSQPSSRNNVSNANYRSKFYPENASFLGENNLNIIAIKFISNFLKDGGEEDNRGRKNVSLPKLAESSLYSNPYKPNDPNIVYFEKGDKYEIQDLKSQITSRQNVKTLKKIPP